MKFRSDKVFARVERKRDFFAPVEKLKQKLPKGASEKLICAR